MFYGSLLNFFHFLELDSITVEEFDYQILKRKVLAEFELNENQPIKVGGNFIGKSEALNFLDVIRDPNVLKQYAYRDNYQ